MNIGILHPGEMGAAIGTTLVASGIPTTWFPEGRSSETLQRATDAGMVPAGSLDELTRECEIILSICPPHAAIDVARQVAATSDPFHGIYLDANAVSPATAAIISSTVSTRGARYVDGGLIGSPPPEGHPRWYLSGVGAEEVAELLSEVPLEIIVVGESPTAASALKMAYASWTKGTAALLLNIRAIAKLHGVDDALVKEWQQSQRELIKRCDHAADAAMSKGWRWAGELEEIAATFADASLPEGFGRAAAEVYRRVPRQAPIVDGNDLQRVIDNLTS